MTASIYIEKIKNILNQDHLSDSQKWNGILQEIASDENAVPHIMQLLAVERSSKKRLIDDMNLELSRADVHIQNPTLAARDDKAKDYIKEAQAKEYVLNHITAFYVKYKGIITHCFNKQA